MNKIKLGLIDLKMNGLSYYRNQGVFYYVSKALPNLEMSFAGDKDTWHNTFMNDVYYINRPMGQQHLNTIRHLKSLKKIVIIDWDDTPFSLPVTHPSYRAYSSKQMMDANVEILKLADVVTVSTQELVEVMKPFNSNIVLIRNAFNDYLHDFKVNPTRKSDVFWRGSQFHRHDLYAFKDEMAKLIIENDNNWVFNGGDDHWFLHNETLEHARKIQHLPPRDVINYMSMLSNYSPLVVHVPLENNKFNKSKSNIALLEGALSGTTAVCPDWEEWSMLDGALTYSDQEGYLKLMEAIFRGEIDINKEYETLVTSIKDKLVLSKENKKRIELFKNL